MAGQGNSRRGLGQDHGRRADEAAGRHAVRRQAHVLGRLREDRRHGRSQVARRRLILFKRLDSRRRSTMTDVRDAAVPTTDRGSGPNPTGDFIWYELMTPDPEGSKAFYDAVVGWNIGQGEAAYNGYRMINSDGGFAGGVLPLTDEMQQHGARPTWLGYIYVPDVDQAIGKIEDVGGKALMPAMDIPNVGRIAMVADPQDAPFYVMTPIPPEGRENEPSDVFSPDKVGRCGWNELQTSDSAAARRFYGEQF